MNRLLAGKKFRLTSKSSNPVKLPPYRRVTIVCMVVRTGRRRPRRRDWCTAGRCDMSLGPAFSCATTLSQALLYGHDSSLARLT